MPDHDPRPALRLTLQARLFLALALLLAVVLTLFVGLSRVGLQRSIGPYVAEIEIGRLDWLADNVARAYAAHGRDWAFLRGSESTWHALQWPSGTGPGTGAPPDARAPGAAPAMRRGPPPGPPPFRRDDAELEGVSGRLKPPPPPDADPDDARAGPDALYRRLAVLQADGTRVIGHPDAGTVRTPLRVDGRTVGWLALAPLQGLGSATDRAFVARQSGFIAGAGLAGLVLALGLSAWIARRWLLRPIESLAAGAAQVSQGRFEVQVPVHGQDELGGLARAFNRMAAQLAATEATRSEWLAAAAHELRTPVTALRAEIEALQDGVRRFDPGTATRLHTQVMRLGRLIDDLRLVTDEAYGAPLHQEPLEPFALLADTAAAFAPRLQERGLELEGVAALRRLQADSGAHVRGDPLRLEQLLSNLLENSLRYTDAPGRVQVQGAIDRPAGALTLAVADSAPGPREGDYARLFDRFFRGEASRSRELGGSGLGLAICRTIAQAHAGRLEASPSPLGGLRVVLTLPLEAP